MKKGIKMFSRHVMRFVDYIMNDNVSAYATSSAYFIVLSFIPFLLLLMTSVQFTPLTKDMVRNVLFSITPEGFQVLLGGIINEVYSKSLAVVPISAVITLWSAGKGIQAITKGLNVIYNTTETRNYFMMRLRSIFYTIILVLVIIITLILMVFGNKIQGYLMVHIPIITKLTAVLLNMRVLIVTFVLAVIFMAMYKLLPNHKCKLRYQLPGAIFAAVSWSICSFAFSIYIDYFESATTMYGSLTTIVLALLWMYACMYLVLVGAEVNVAFFEKAQQ